MRETRDRTASSTLYGLTRHVDRRQVVNDHGVGARRPGVIMVFGMHSRLMGRDVAMSHATVVVRGLVPGVSVQVGERRRGAAHLQAKTHEQDESQASHVTGSVAHRRSAVKTRVAFMEARLD
jgi:hypothetical protein